MDTPKFRSALIVGTGPGLSASLARLFASNGLKVALAARTIDKPKPIENQRSSRMNVPTLLFWLPMKAPLPGFRL